MYEILTKVHEAYPDMYPLVPTWAGGGMQETLPIDPLGDNLGVLENAFEGQYRGRGLLFDGQLPRILRDDVQMEQRGA